MPPTLRVAAPLLILLLACDPGPDPAPPEPVPRPGTPLPAAWAGGPCSPLPPITGFVSRSGAALRLEGSPFRALGANLYYLQQQSTYGSRPGGERNRAQVEAALDALVCLGVTVARTNGFNDDTKDAGSAIRTAPDRIQEDGLRGLDAAVAAAKARGIRLILPLTNYWEAFGGLVAYAGWAGKRPDDFFGDAQMMGYWKDHVDRLLDRVNTVTGVRYRDEPTILAWEIGNELRCPSCRGSDRYVETIRALARHLKARAPHQLVSDGGEGHDAPAAFPGLSPGYAGHGDTGARFTKLAAIAELDLLSYHFYAGNWGLVGPRDAAVWIERHEEIARAAGKVAYLGEFGHHAPPARDDDRARDFHEWLSHLFDHEAGSIGILWQLVPAVRTGSGERRQAVVFDEDRDTLGVLASWATRVRGDLP